MARALEEESMLRALTETKERKKCKAQGKIEAYENDLARKEQERKKAEEDAGMEVDA